MKAYVVFSNRYQKQVVAESPEQAGVKFVEFVRQTDPNPQFNDLIAVVDGSGFTRYLVTSTYYPNHRPNWVLLPGIGNPNNRMVSR